MFEATLQRILTGVNASDGLIAGMGPTLTILLALAIGTAAAQFLKFPLSQTVQEPWFSWWVRVVGVVVTAVFAFMLSNTVPLWLAIGVGLLQPPVVYHGGLAIIRRWFPWLEMKPFVGAVCPPASAHQAAAQRAADKAGDESGT